MEHPENVYLPTSAALKELRRATIERDSEGILLFSNGALGKEYAWLIDYSPVAQFSQSSQSRNQEFLEIYR